jgi:hypothetical protein
MNNFCPQQHATGMCYWGSKMQMMKSAIGVLLVSLGSTGCNQLPQKDEAKQAQFNVLKQISDATAVAVDAQRDLAMAAEGKQERTERTRKSILTDQVSYDFYGNVEDIVREIANRYQYRFEVYGKVPPEKVMTNVFVTRKPAIEVLKQIGYTSTVWLDIAVKKDVIEIRYKSK